MQRRARGKNGRFLKRGSAAKRRRGSKRRPRRNPMRSVRSASGKAVSAKRWRSSGYRRNPPRLKLVQEVLDLGRDALITLVGRSGARMAVGFAKKPDGTPMLAGPMEPAAQVLLGVGIKLFGKRFLPTNIVNHLALGAATVAVESAVQMAPFLPQVVKEYLASYPQVVLVPTDAQGNLLGLGAYDSDPGAGYTNDEYWTNAQQN